MHFTAILAVAAVSALPALASPGGESLVAHTGKCKGDLVWNGWKNACVVSPVTSRRHFGIQLTVFSVRTAVASTTISTASATTRPSPSLCVRTASRPTAPEAPRTTASTVRSHAAVRPAGTELTLPDAGDKRCRDDGKSYTFCSGDRDVPDKVKEVCPPQKRKDCLGGQFYDYKTDLCVCKPGEVYRDEKCQHPPLPRPHCPYGQKEYCAKDKDNWVEYGEWRPGDGAASSADPTRQTRRTACATTTAATRPFAASRPRSRTTARRTTATRGGLETPSRGIRRG